MRSINYAASLIMITSLMITTIPKGANTVIGGHPVDVSDAPWVVALASREIFGDNRSGQFCGGVVVSRRTVLTAAHCLSQKSLGIHAADKSNLRVIAGRKDLGNTTGAEIPLTSIRIDSGMGANASPGDVATLTLSKSLPASYSIPIAGPRDKAYATGTTAEIYGWGDVNGDGSYADVLQSTQVHLLADTECLHAYAHTKRQYRPNSMLCAGVRDGGKDACQGDSGGPLVALGKLVGLVSWGSGCGSSKFPGVYARASAAAEYIEGSQ
ncbi:serine protease [Streptomyces olivoreticuli]